MAYGVSCPHALSLIWRGIWSVMSSRLITNILVSRHYLLPLLSLLSFPNGNHHHMPPPSTALRHHRRRPPPLHRPTPSPLLPLIFFFLLFTSNPTEPHRFHYRITPVNSFFFEELDNSLNLLDLHREWNKDNKKQLWLCLDYEKNLKGKLTWNEIDVAKKKCLCFYFVSYIFSMVVVLLVP